MSKSSLFFLLCLTGFACAGSAFAVGNISAGKSKAATCAGCHGEDGNSMAPIFPRLAGQNEAFLVRELTDFKGHLREDPSMEAFAAALSEQDIEDLSAYFASKKPILAKASDEEYVDEDEEIPVTRELISQGKVLFLAGNETTHVPACTGCHGPSGSGNPAAGFPKLKGQFLPYLVKALNDFREENRTNDDGAMMRTIAKKMTKAEINSVSAYISRLR